MSSVLLTILGISLLIFIHEFGHYICARMAGVTVKEFSLGFGPRLCGIRRGPTDYRISAIPLGGYVMVSGDDPTVDRRLLSASDLCSKGPLVRAFFYSGGVIMNVVFALVAFPLVFNSGVLFVAPIVGEVTPGGAAWEAGLQTGDEVLQVGGKQMYSFPNFRVEVALANASRGVEVVYRRDGERRSCHVFPRYSEAFGLRDMGVREDYEQGPYRVVFELEGVAPESTPEHKAGLRPGDTLLTMNGQEIRSLQDWQRAGEDYLAGLGPDGPTPVTLTVRRQPAGGGAATGHEIVFTPMVRDQSPLRIGVAPLPRTVSGLRQGNQDVEALKIRRGDRIRFVNGQRFTRGELEFETGRDPDRPQRVEVVVERKGEKTPIKLVADIPPERQAALAGAIALRAQADDLVIQPLAGTPAAHAGMRSGDRITAIDGRAVSEWDDLVAAVTEAKGKPLQLALVQSDGIKTVTLTAKRNPTFGFAPNIEPVRTLFRKDSIGAAIGAGWVASIDFIKQIYVTLKRLFTGDVSPRNLGGIITISRVSYAFAEEGLARLFYFLAILSINLAVINVLPIPVLDGGHLTFLLIEKIKGSPVSTRVHNYSQILGLVFVLALMVYVTFNDIRRWLDL